MNKIFNTIKISILNNDKTYKKEVTMLTIKKGFPWVIGDFFFVLAYIL